MIMLNKKTGKYIVSIIRKGREHSFGASWPNREVAESIDYAVKTLFAGRNPTEDEIIALKSSMGLQTSGRKKSNKVVRVAVTETASA